MEDTIRPFDTLIIKELDRLGRDMQGIKEEWDYFTERYVNIVVIDMPILNTTNRTELDKKLIGDIVFTLLSYLTEKEVEHRSQRVKERMNIAKEKGFEIGKPGLTKDDLQVTDILQLKPINHFSLTDI